jgi:hypothetical protein
MLMGVTSSVHNEFDPVTQGDTSYVGLTGYTSGSSTVLGNPVGIYTNNFFFGSGQEQYWRSFFDTEMNMPA